jgi:hypothetical protein
MWYAEVNRRGLAPSGATKKLLKILLRERLAYDWGKEANSLFGI